MANEKRHRGILIATIIFLVCLLGYVTWLLIWGQYRETTEDTYVNGNMITITPQVKGIVTTILTDNTQLVEAGQPIVMIDKHDYEIALEGAKADLGEAVRQVVQLVLKVEELNAKKERATASLSRAILDFKHREALVGDGSVSREEFEHSETTLAAAFAQVVEVEKEYEAAYAEVQNTSVSTHPKVEMAKSNLRQAFLHLHRCAVLAPARGIITQRKAQVGQWVKEADPLMALVPVDQMWVDANFREVSLKNFRIGQPVTLHADMYGRGVKYRGQLVGLNPGTGSVFSVLPPQNATGNWIKVIQRIPVKISIHAEDLKAYPLVLGLSMTATVDTHVRNGLRLPNATRPKALYVSDVYKEELDGVDDLINSIILANAPVYE